MSRHVDSYLDDTKTINLSLSLPVNLKCDDGREFEIISWEPAFTAGGYVKARIEVAVKVPE